MKNRINERLGEISTTTLIVGVDIAKAVHWARFVDYRGKEVGKAVSFKSDRKGFESIQARIREVLGNESLRQTFDSVLIGMEPTGHYWKTFADHMMKSGCVVQLKNQPRYHQLLIEKSAMVFLLCQENQSFLLWSGWFFI